jgi:hypothetical protein
MVVLLLAATALVLMIWLMWQRHVRCVDLIEGELRRYHFTGIKASIAWGNPAFHAYTYSVRYQDTRGRRHRNRARIHIRDEHADAVQWQHRLERLSSQRRTIDEGVDRAGTANVNQRLPLITDVQTRRVTK